MLVFLAFLFYILIFALLISLIIFAILFVTSPYTYKRVSISKIPQMQTRETENRDEDEEEENKEAKQDNQKTEHQVEKKNNNNKNKKQVEKQEQNLNNNFKKELRTPLKLKKEIRTEQIQLLNHFTDCLEQAGISFWATKTTLLAAVKFGKLFPWDDKITVAILHSDLAKLSEIRPKLEKGVFGAKLVSGKHNWIYYKDNVSQFPNIEIAVMNIRFHEVSVCTPTNALGECSYQDSFTRRKEVFPTNYVFPLTKVNFGTSFIFIPVNAKECLTLLYGPKWNLVWQEKQVLLNEKTRGLVKRLKLIS